MLYYEKSLKSVDFVGGKLSYERRAVSGERWAVTHEQWAVTYEQ
jgi:hypothetical protein